MRGVVERLASTLMVDCLAIFLASNDAPTSFMLAKSFGISSNQDLDLSFLSKDRPEFRQGHLFFDSTRQAVRETPSAQQTIAQLDLNYYIPCTVQNRSEEHTSELQSHLNLVCRLLLEKKKTEHQHSDRSP